jgi:uncharacterized GH25 family protein
LKSARSRWWRVGQKVEIVPESDQKATYAGEVIRIAGV